MIKFYLEVTRGVTINLDWFFENMEPNSTDPFIIFGVKLRKGSALNSWIKSSIGDFQSFFTNFSLPRRTLRHVSVGVILNHIIRFICLSAKACVIHNTIRPARWPIVHRGSFVDIDLRSHNADPCPLMPSDTCYSKWKRTNSSRTYPNPKRKRFPN